MAELHRALIVDDQADARALVRAVLEQSLECDTVVEASDGLDALDHLAASTFDLLVTDLVMPVMTGLELLGYVRSDPRHAGMRTLVLSAHVEPRDLAKVHEVGAQTVLAKPAAPDALATAIERLIRGE